MIRVWKIIFSVAAVLFLLGVVLAGTGLLTGASPARIAELLFGGWDAVAEAIAAAAAEAAQVI